MDLFEDLADMARRRLTQLGYPPEGDEDAETLVRRCVDLNHRLPPEMEWTIEESTELQEKKEEEEEDLPDDIVRGLERFNQKAREGKSLVPHLSRKIPDPDYVDDLLVDWNVTHFHLGEELRDDGLIEGTDEVLFAVLDPANGIMYQLDVHGHDEGRAWSRQELVNIMERNWPELIQDHELKGIEGGYTDEEVRQWRELGVNPGVQTDSGAGYASMGGGLTAAGTSGRSTRFVTRAKRLLEDLESEILEDREKWDDHFRTQHDLDWDDLEFRLTEYGNRVRVQEANTGVVVIEKDLS